MIELILKNNARFDTFILKAAFELDFEDQLNVALKTDYKYFLTINLKKIFGQYLPHEGGF